MPSRADIDPVDIPKLLPDVMLVERDHDDGRHRYRLIGTENTRAHGVNATGRLDEVPPGPDYCTHVLGGLRRVRERRPWHSECLFFPPGREEPERHTKVLFMPLSPDGVRVNMVFVIQVFLYIDRATRERHFVDASGIRKSPTPFSDLYGELGSVFARDGGDPGGRALPMAKVGRSVSRHREKPAG